MEDLILSAPPVAAVKALQGDYQRAVGRRDEVDRRLKAVVGEIADLEAEDELLDLVGGLFRTMIDNEVTANVKAVERLLTEGLGTIFEDMDLEVQSKVELQRGKVAVDLITVQREPDGTVTEGDATSAYGGSVATVQSVLLRVIVILRRRMRPVILLDESLGAIADHYVPKFGKFLSLVCSRLKMDILAVTHDAALAEVADRAYRIRKIGSKATFTEVR